MALSDVGTAYVIIKANTEQLAGDIGKGFKKGAADADDDIAKSGSEGGKSYKKGMLGEIGDGEIGDGVTESLNTPEINKNSEKAGANVSRRVKKGHDKENKKHNPFASLGDSLGQVFSGMAKLKWPAILLAAPDVLGGLANIIGASLAGITEALGFLVEAAAGAGAALVGIGVVAIPALAVLFAAFKVSTDELDSFKEAAKPLIGQWKNVAVAVQKKVLPAMLGFLETSQLLIPMWVEFGDHIGTIAGNFLTMAGNVLTSNKNLDAFATIMENSEKFFGLISESLLVVFDALIPVFAILAPLGVQFAESLRKMADHLAEFLAQPGKLDELSVKFQDWYDKLAQVFRIIGNVFTALWEILGVGAEFGTSMFDSLEKVTGKWAEWTQSIEGQTALQDWFAKSQPLMHEIWLLIKDIADIVIGPIIDVDSQQGTIDFVHTLRTDWLPTFKDIFDALGNAGVGEALQTLADALVDFINSFSGSSTIVATIDTFAKVIEGFAKVLSDPLVAEVAPTLAAIYGGLAVFKFLKLDNLAKDVFAVGSGFLNLGKGLFATGEGVAAAKAAGGLQSLGATLAPIAGPLLAVAAAIAAIWAVWHFWDEIMAGLKTAWEWFTKLSTPIQILVGILAGMTAIIMAPLLGFIGLIFGVIAVFKNWEAIAGFVDRVWDAIFNFFTGLPDLIGKLPGLLGGVGLSILNFFEGVGESILGFLGRLPGIIGGALLGALTAIPGLVMDALSGLANVGLGILQWIADGIVTAAPVVAQFFTELPIKILGWVGQAFSALTGLGTNILQWIIEGLVEWLPKVLVFFIKMPFEILTLLRKANVEMVKIGWRILMWMIDGLVEAWPSILDFFKKLPRRIIDALEAAGKFLLSVGRSIIDGMWQGIQTAWDIGLDFFKKLPRRILDALINSAMWLRDVGSGIINGMWQGIQSSWDAGLEFFTGLPARIMGYFTSTIDWLKQVGGDLIQGLWNGIQEVFASVNEFFMGMPQALLDLVLAGAPIVASIGSSVIQWILDAITTAATTVWDWFTGLPQALWDLVSGASQKIIDIGSDAIGWIVSGLVSVAQDVWNWFLDFPQAAWDTVSGISQKIMDIGLDAIGWILDGIHDAEVDLWTWFTELPGVVWQKVQDVSQKVIDIGKDMIGWIVEGLEGLASTLWTTLTEALPSPSDVMGAIKGIFTSAINLLPDLTPGFDVPGVPFFEMGGIIPGSALGMPVIVGERFKSEAIVPMERPGRALAVMQQAGLDKMVLNAYMGSSTDAPAGVAGRDVTMLHIDRATITAPVDADMIVQKIATAYRRMAS